MINTYQDVISLFGGDDEATEVLALNFSVKHSDFTWQDLLKCIELIIENFHDMTSDSVLISTLLPSRQVGRSNISFASMISQLKQRFETKTCYHSDIVLRNMFKLMFETSIWDQDIISNSDFTDGFEKVCQKLDADARDFAHKTSISLPVLNTNDLIDARDAIFELKDRLFEKISLLSGI